ncbi:hypothetical protein D3C71_2189070 [compost metagenome]
MYANEGLVVLTDQIFPDTPLDHMEISAKSGEVVLNSLHIHALNSIHTLSGTSEQTARRVNA